MNGNCPQLQVRPTNGVLIVFRFSAADEIDFDVDLRELQGQERLDLFCRFLAAIGRKLGNPVRVNHEGGDGSCPFLGFDVEADRVLLFTESEEPRRG